MPARKNNDTDSNEVHFHIHSTPKTKNEIKKRFTANGYNLFSPKRAKYKAYKSPNKSYELRKIYEHSGKTYGCKRVLFEDLYVDSSSTESQDQEKVDFEPIGPKKDKSLTIKMYDKVDDNNIIDDEDISFAKLPETEFRDFGKPGHPITIDLVNGLRPQKASRRSPPQKEVMGITADEAWQKLAGMVGYDKTGESNFGQNPKMHWCHLVGFCLANGIVQPQTKDNLVSGTHTCNYNMRDYEVYLKKMAEKGLVDKIQLWGQAEIFKGSDVALNIYLNVHIHWKNGYANKYTLTFHPQSNEKENHQFRKAVQLVNDHVSELSSSAKSSCPSPNNQ